MLKGLNFALANLENRQYDINNEIFEYFIFHPTPLLLMPIGADLQHNRHLSEPKAVSLTISYLGYFTLFPSQIGTKLRKGINMSQKSWKVLISSYLHVFFIIFTCYTVLHHPTSLTNKVLFLVCKSYVYQFG